jgi:hypothetical protein
MRVEPDGAMKNSRPIIALAIALAIFARAVPAVLAQESGHPSEQPAGKSEGEANQPPELEVELTPDDAVTKLWVEMPTISRKMKIPVP